MFFKFDDSVTHEHDAKYIEGKPDPKDPDLILSNKRSEAGNSENGHQVH